ncbi:MAG: SGNH/GDSL hydrolase family protein, partial [Flavihumibacter sp.]|nr:SGNH/GDSL hydrolase family protein [Flavihumibacter sp.]
LLSWSFASGLTGWSSSGSGSTWALSGSNLQVSGGGSSSDYTNYYKYDSYPIVFAGQQPSIVNFIPSVNASGAGEGLGIGIKTNDNVLDFLVKIDLSNTATRGQLLIYRIVSGTPTLLSTSATNLAFTTNVDSLSLELHKRVDGFVVAKAFNNTTGNSVQVISATSVAWGVNRMSKVAIWHFGGTQLIPTVNLKNSSPKYKKLALIGDSITNLYYFTFLSQGYSEAYLEAGSGSTSANIVSCLDSILNCGATNAILMIGMNDAINSVSSATYISNVRIIVNALQEVGINPVICYVTPTNNAGYNTFIQSYNTALLAEYNGVYTIVDTYSPLSVGNNLTGLLQSGYNSGDDIHPNSTGCGLITRTIQNATAASLMSFLNNPARTVDIQTFGVGSWIWTKPAKAKVIKVICIGAGGGGGSGRKSASGTLASGGAGGGTGSVAIMEFDASSITATVNISVSAGGAGGASVTANSTNGNPGSNGAANTSFGTYLIGARGSVVAGGGTAVGAAAAGTANSGMFTGVSGGASSASGGVGSNGANSTLYAPSGGGAGGGINTAAVASAGGSGGFVFAANSVQAAGGGVGANGTPGTNYGWLGSGGGGGGASTTGNGGNGGNGAFYGAGGGGGGAALDGIGNSGAGGRGGDGVCVVITFF